MQDTYKKLPALDITEDLVTQTASGDNAVRVAGEINLVSLPSDGETLVNTFNEISSVIKDTLTTIVTYTAPVGKVSFLQYATAGGDNIATYQVEINGTVESKRRTYFGAPLTTDFQFYSTAEAGIELSVGDVVRIRVEHGRPTVGDFEGNIQILEIG